jgi:TolA-binding protein
VRPFAALLLPVLLAACAPEPPPLPPPPASPRPLVIAAASFPFPSSPELEALRDPRRAGPQKPRALLVTEIQGLESLFAATPREAPDRPTLVHRLAEEYVELVRAALRDHDERAAKIVVAGRRAAIAYYTRLVNEYPGWCHAGTSGCADETRYLAGLEYERAGDLDHARRLYLDVVQNHPASRFAAYAYLAFGELFVPEAEADPSKWPLARQSFEEVIKSPPPDNPLYGYALLRLAQIHARLGHPDEARARRQALRDLAAKSPGWAPAEIPARLLGQDAP